MFKKVYGNMKKEDFRENPFSVIEVTRKTHSKRKNNFPANQQEDIENLEENVNHCSDDFDEIDDDVVEDVPFYDDNDDDSDFDDYDEDQTYEDDSDSSVENDCTSFENMDFGSVNWGDVDFASIDWSQY